jgi:hypothetical protein
MDVARYANEAFSTLQRSGGWVSTRLTRDRGSMRPGRIERLDEK